MNVEQLTGRRVVVVDDDLDQAATLAHLLRGEGIDATHEHFPLQALENLMLDPPDVVIVDVKMPGLSGPDLVATLRVKNRSLPAVFLTGCAEHDPLVKIAVDARRAVYLAKPVEIARLLDALCSLLGPSLASSTASSARI